MKEKIVTIILMMIGTSVLTCAVFAQPPSNIALVMAYTNDIQYAPGEDGKLYIAVLNYRTSPVEIKNITIYYPWFTYAKDKGWSGNDTIIPAADEKTLSSGGGKFEREVGFSVPSDGRVVQDAFMFPSAHIIVYDKDGNFLAESQANINIVVPTAHSTIEGLNEITTLFTIQVILLIVCTIIVAATIFLSGRKPPAVFRREERAE